MIDNRKALQKGTILNFPGVSCEVGEEIGRGSNSLVYQGSYRDAHDQEQVHHVLIKELFPLHMQGKIFRLEDNSICVEPEGQDTFEMHRESFETGNKVHLKLLEACPDQIGANLNTFSLNGTLYSVLGVSGGQSLAQMQTTPVRSLRSIAKRALSILEALETFHANGLAHLDIAPDNILLLGSGERERALLIDYNSTMTISAARRKDAVIFSIKQGYTAPEIRAGQADEISFASDMYSVTAVLYWMITGSALSLFQMVRPAPPDVSGAPCMRDEPETVKVWVQEILRRGLQSLPSRRYQTTFDMRRDLEELIDRIDGVGITHWALWEAGRKRVARMVRDNPSLSFIRDSANLYPSMISDGTELLPAEDCIRKLPGSCMLVAGGGMGKTTSLLRLVFSGNKTYRPKSPAVMYLSLYGWQPGDGSFIINSILDELHYHAETHTYDDARKVLYELLDKPMILRDGEAPVLLLLLDGLNEITGDPKPLLDEIRRLSAMRGVRLAVASRVGEESLPFPQLHLAELSDGIVQDVLSKEGLLLPEADGMKALLRTPLMLSMYVKAGQLGGKQVRVNTADELLKTYLLALKEKAVQDLSEQTNRRWQVEAALEFALPAIAAEIHRERRGLKDAELLPVIAKCFRILSGPLSRRFFPQWIGRTAAIRGGARNAEEWYGQIVHDILWKQLGLVSRDEQGKYVVFHQVVEEYLLTLSKANDRRIQRYHWLRGTIAAICSCITVGLLIYFIVPSPLPPYDETYADNIMERILKAYVVAGYQYESLSSLADAAIESPEAFETQYFYYQGDVKKKYVDPENALVDLSDMLSSGEAMPWSNLPMDEEACIKLLTLSYDRWEEDYQKYVSVLEYVMTDDLAYRYYGKIYPDLFSQLLEIDADIAAELYQIVCEPHLKGKYADHSVTAESFRSLYASVSKQNGHMDQQKGDLSRLESLEKDRIDLITKINTSGALYGYGT